jgi:poly(A) polymerase
VTDTLDRQALRALLERPRLRRLLEALNSGGVETRIVGGALRNALLGLPVTEVDCTTSALPEETIRRAEAAGFKAVPTGLEHGTITVVVDGEPFEVTTLREDVETDGRRAVVRFGQDFAMDARRRDFTINALSLSATGELFDYTAGLADLAARRVRFIGDAGKRIREDFLRILRFFRFFAEYADGEPDPSGLFAAIRERAGLATLSHERIRSELLKLLVARRAPDAVRILSETGLLALSLGGVAERGRFERVAAGEGAPDPVRRLAALAVMVPEDADRLRERLRLSNEEHERLRAYAGLVTVLKTRPVPVDPRAIRILVADVGIEPVHDALLAVAGEPRPALADGALEALERYRSGAEPVPVFPLRGADFIAGGVPKGPKIGELMALARRAWLSEACPMDEASREALLRRTLDLA